MHNVKKTLAACLALMGCGQNMESTEPPSSQLTTRTQARFLRAAEPVQGEYIVVLKEQPGLLGSSDVASQARSMARAYSTQVLNTYSHALRGFVMQGDEAAARAMSADPAVAYVQENGRVQMAATQDSPPAWGVDRVDQDALPLNRSYSSEADGAGIHAYVLDTGIRSTHSEFEGRATKDFDTYVGTALDTGGDDCNGHGTHVAGTLGGKTFGVAKKVQLHGVRVLSCTGGGSYAGIIAGVDWVTGNAQKPAVANMSLGGGQFQAMDDAVNNSINSGIVYVVAAGNSTANACDYSPARVPQAITVGATTDTDARRSDSNFGSCLDIFAPGQLIASAWVGSDTDTRTISGTSMAAPHVAGAAALLLAQGVPAGSVAARLVSDSTLNKVTSAGTDSPNRLLFIGNRGQQIFNTAANNVTDAINGTRNFYLDVPAGLSSVTFSTSGGTGDVDLYVRFNGLPTKTDYDCRPLRSGNTETCIMNAPQAGRWYVQLRAYKAYANVTMKGEY